MRPEPSASDAGADTLRKGGTRGDRDLLHQVGSQVEGLIIALPRAHGAKAAVRAAPKNHAAELDFVRDVDVEAGNRIRSRLGDWPEFWDMHVISLSHRDYWCL
uniref:Uncharacterized protein n=1 Tax=Bosea sp. NBC_00436 TaxID=2969620 RepID=A0A9E8A241_9HYPH